LTPFKEPVLRAAEVNMPSDPDFSYGRIFVLGWVSSG